MASEKFTKDSEEFKFFGEFWQLAQKYYVTEDSDEYWENLIKDCVALEKKYPGKFFLQMLVGLQVTLEEVHKEKKGIQ